MLQEGFYIQDCHSDIVGTRLERLVSVICLLPWNPEKSVCRTDLIHFNQIMNEAKAL